MVFWWIDGQLRRLSLDAECRKLGAIPEGGWFCGGKQLGGWGLVRNGDSLSCAIKTPIDRYKDPHRSVVSEGMLLEECIESTRTASLEEEVRWRKKSEGGLGEHMVCVCPRGTQERVVGYGCGLQGQKERGQRQRGQFLGEPQEGRPLCAVRQQTTRTGVGGSDI